MRRHASLLLAVLMILTPRRSELYDKTPLFTVTVTVCCDGITGLRCTASDSGRYVGEAEVSAPEGKPVKYGGALTLTFTRSDIIDPDGLENLYISLELERGEARCYAYGSSLDVWTPELGENRRFVLTGGPEEGYRCRMECGVRAWKHDFAPQPGQ